MTLADIAKRLNQDYTSGLTSDQNKSGRKDIPFAFFITDQKAVPQPEEVISTLPAGCFVIFRDYDDPDRSAKAEVLLALCRKNEISFLVAGDPDLAVQIGADGVHLPQGMMDDVTEIRKWHPEWFITVACHDIASVEGLSLLPVDAALVAPTFPTLSHPETFLQEKLTLGVVGVRDMVAKSNVPLYALGGVTAENANDLTGVGVAGIAAIRGFGNLNR